jgi:hypothetical protein
MSLHLICPACGSASEFYSEPASCPKCAAPFPPVLRASAASSITRERLSKPTLLVLGQWWAAITGLVFLVLVTLAPFGIGTYSINGEAVSGPEFFHQAGAVFGVVGGLSLGIGLALIFEATWVRPLMVGFWVVIQAAAFAASSRELGDLLTSFLAAAITTSVAAWYLYKRPNVNAYFSALEAGLLRRDV